MSRFASGAAIALLCAACSSEPDVPRQSEAASAEVAEQAGPAGRWHQSAETAATSAPQSQPSATLAAMVVDPACLTTVAWFADRESSDIKLSGCRSADLLPAADEQGWRTFEGEDGERLMVRGTTIDAQSGALSFEVGYNGGGTMSGRYRVAGVTAADGVLKVGQYTITPLD